MFSETRTSTPFIRLMAKCLSLYAIVIALNGTNAAPNVVLSSLLLTQPFSGVYNPSCQNGLEVFGGTFLFYF